MLTLLDRQTHEQRGNARDHGRREARPADDQRSPSGPGPQQAGAEGQQSFGPIKATPIARTQRFAARVHRPHREDAGNRGGDMNAFAAVVARRGHDQDATAKAPIDRVDQAGMGRPGRRILATTDVDHLSPMLRGQENRPGQIKLRARRREESVVLSRKGSRDVAENGHHDPPASRSDPLNRASAEDQARHQSAVPRRRPTEPRFRRHSDFDRRQIRPDEGRVRSIDRPIEHRDRDPRIARRLRPEIAESPNRPN